MASTSAGAARKSPTRSSKNNSADEGGGIYIEYADVEITDCHLIDNVAGYGGGIYTYGASPTITGGLVQGNEAWSHGGGMRFTCSYVTCTGIDIVENDAVNDGGGAFFNRGSTDISECTFTGNGNNGVYGGGLELYEVNATVTKCLFEDNTALEGGGIGMFQQWFYTTRIEKNIFRGNTAATSGGGIYTVMSRDSEIYTNVFLDNEAQSGGGIGMYYASPRIINNTITGNNTTANRGGGICADYSSMPLVHNSIVSDNTSDTDSNRAEIYVANSDCIVYVSNSNVNRSESGGYGIISWRDGNIEEDPMFTDEYHISGSSPCVNAGSRTAVLPGGEGTVMAPFRDIDDTFRPQDGEWDIGADETAMEWVLENPELPEELTLSTYPNPFNSTLSITAPRDAFVTIYDTHGRQVADLGKGRIWNAGKDMPSGVYLVKATVGKKVVEEKTVLVK